MTDFSSQETCGRDSIESVCVCVRARAREGGVHCNLVYAVNLIWIDLVQRNEIRTSVRNFPYPNCF